MHINHDTWKEYNAHPSKDIKQYIDPDFDVNSNYICLCENEGAFLFLEEFYELK